jgi:predicted ATPase/DNA-binding winged helix-turn-helix (wHTH) protein
MGDVFSFGPFRLLAATRLLLKDGQPVPLGSRALDILNALVEQAGKVICRRDLIARVWPGLVVEDANLRIHIASLRKVLGDGLEGARYIANINGRGYCFVAPVGIEKAVTPQAARATSTAASMPARRLPPRLSSMVGREETVVTLATLLASHPIVSVVGPGGIGKTTVAVAVAHALSDDFADAICFVDLCTLSDAALVPIALASALGISAQQQDPLAALPALFTGRRILLVVDNCEHVVEEIAAIAERLFKEAPQLHLLTTSREALRIEGEHVHRLQPLDNPPERAELSAGEALGSAAVRLFMERAAASGHSKPLDDADAPLVAGICRALDGNPLAIELAAGCVGAYGIRGAADLVADCFALLRQRRRCSARPRHQSLQAMLDWSYCLLSERDRLVLTRLAVFVGTFTLEAVQAVAGDETLHAFDVAAAVRSLLDKSLLTLCTPGGDGRLQFRLLNIMRAYAADKGSRAKFSGRLSEIGLIDRCSS